MPNYGDVVHLLYVTRTTVPSSMFMSVHCTTFILCTLFYLASFLYLRTTERTSIVPLRRVLKGSLMCVKQQNNSPFQSEGKLNAKASKRLEFNMEAMELH